MNKKIILFFLLGFLLMSGKTYSYNTDDVVQKFFTVSPSWSNEYTIPSWYDFIVENANVINNNTNSVSLSVYDDTTLIFWVSFDKWQNPGVYNMYFQDSVKVTSSSTGAFDVYYKWYLIEEWAVIETKNAYDYIQNSIDYINSQDFRTLLSLLIIFALFLWIMWLCMIWGFKTWLIFFKEKYIWRK